MSLTADEIDAVVRELAPLAGARVDEVRVHAERALTLELFGPAGAARLLVSAEPDVTRLHAARARPPRPRAVRVPAAAAAGRSRARASPRSSRRRATGWSRSGSSAPRGPLRLVAELTGRHGNVFLVGDDGVIRASAGRNLSAAAARSSRARRTSPPAPRRPAAGRRAVRFAPVARARLPALRRDRRGATRALEAERLLAEGRRRLREPVRAAARPRGARAREARRRGGARAGRGGRPARPADLLKREPARVRRGAREVTVTEWTEEGPREVAVALDPALTPQANMERYFRRYRRIVESAARGSRRARRRSARARRRCARSSRRSTARRVGELAAARARGAQPRRPRRAPPRPAPPPRRARAAVPDLPLRSPAPRSSSAAAPPRTTRSRARREGQRPLAARARRPGRARRRPAREGAGPDQETLLDAAHLALHFSDARGAPQAEVAYTRAKYVRKPKGAAPGRGHLQPGEGARCCGSSRRGSSGCSPRRSRRPSA